MNECRVVSDMYFIAALLSLGYKLVRTDRTNPRRQKFLFDLNDEIEVMVNEDGVLVTKTLDVDGLEAYFLSRSLLLPGKYVDFLKEVRSTIHGGREDSDYGY